jgi:hypothetical protein
MPSPARISLTKAVINHWDPEAYNNFAPMPERLAARTLALLDFYRQLRATCRQITRSFITNHLAGVGLHQSLPRLANSDRAIQQPLGDK